MFTASSLRFARSHAEPFYRIRQANVSIHIDFKLAYTSLPLIVALVLATSLGITPRDVSAKTSKLEAWASKTSLISPLSVARRLG